jgi:hypothetical protein
MNNLDKLQIYLRAAIAKTTNKQYRKVSDALLESLPDVVRTLAAIITANTSTTAEKLKCLDILQMFWSRLLSNEQSENRTGVKRMAMKVRVRRTKIAEKQTALRVHDLRAAADKKLASLGDK